MPYSEINHFHASIDRHGILSLIWNLWDVLVKTLGTGPTLPSPIQDPQIVMLHRCNAKRAPTKCCFVALQVQMCDCRMPTHTHCCSDLLLTLGRQRNLFHLVDELRSQDKINKDDLNVNRVI